MRLSLLATLISLPLCLPELAIWRGRPHALWFQGAMLGWCIFVMWAFVIGWSEEHAKVAPFRIPSEKVMLLGISGGILLGVVSHLAIDPLLHAPGRIFRIYPKNGLEWLAFAGFYLALETLFTCFAPLAFFARLSNCLSTAVVLTVLLNVAVLAIKLVGFLPKPSPEQLLGSLTLRIVHSVACIWLYVRGGVIPVYLLGLSAQARLLFWDGHAP